MRRPQQFLDARLYHSIPNAAIQFLPDIIQHISRTARRKKAKKVTEELNEKVTKR
jgi:hypothetical protein